MRTSKLSLYGGDSQHRTTTSGCWSSTITTIQTCRGVVLQQDTIFDHPFHTIPMEAHSSPLGPPDECVKSRMRDTSNTLRQRVVRKKLVDNFKNLAIEKCLREPLSAVFISRTMHLLEDIIVANIAAEDESSRHERMLLEEEITILQTSTVAAPLPGSTSFGP